ncbi:MAG: NAD-dependent dihydropyrimidine dehydrogenase subunit PreA [Phycisphaerae bacterium]|nr:NAD-dependent dihydropyrimidine dehydrogenase subunit PreA [Phycisphaerae bacterium]MDG2476800.1 NAD-dependent dihydropyrimidine dehydrogenase subunit PreA [Phycisphaerales bacterium]MBT5381752.1 NAD-dependent dihydropyrimidine dehydrogenase subunit PreA [Phycisphaerae bacterium]MBT5583287.1 NAD-dependent dihydropyrimidine dehydrogenase subunit PreA [Phycisphaerae bacterium]MBT5657705.1 NAD-dependent dihydropyrimidine dehydrogenase subunit PreA [Phycisphaerae bacterium]
MSKLAVTVNGLKFKNPFVIGSGPPGTNANVINKAFVEGWGGVVAKTISLEADKVTNVAPRYARMRAQGSKEVFGWENIELISDRPFETWLDEFKAIKDAHPEGILIASIMEEYRRDAWIEIVERCQEVGIDAFELNFSCPHGLPERKMGMAMGENPEIVAEVSSWAMESATVPVWAKMTPNVTHIADPGRAALQAGCNGLAAINTILSVMGVDLKTLRPMPTVEGYAVPGGYSCKAVRPIALRMVMELSRMQTADFPDATISGIGGIETGQDAAQFILLGAHTVQVCTGVMIHGYDMAKDMCEQLSAFMDQHGFASIDEFRGASLPYFTTHADLVRRQAEAKAAAKARREGMVEKDTQWEGDKFVEQSDRLVSND